ncbi:PREDICTED: ATP-dependent DNA helicase PIF1-like [Camelina sativa]|uniref:ATP-dependent DNA helicase n=1 Tax=Camelina sativa TaxID=90675 RepID=A0ABM1R6H7_CAMSA|nr:PREDICTED: ATP-dependent DNA helicase PIF1-like [Camelina sativa]
MRSNGSSLSTIVNMPKPDGSVMDNNENRLLIDERNFKRDEKVKNYDRLLRMATDEQKSVYLEIINVVNRNKGGMFFVHGFGGTGKTFLWSIIGVDIRSRGDIVLNVASSGIAALLMEGGRTPHSRFSIAIHVDKYTTCSIDVNSHLAELIREARLIIWDEAPMMNKNCFETLDRSLRDIMKCDRVFKGKVFVLGGDFRQILPVVPEAGIVGTVLVSINSSLLWNSFKVLQLTQNMRFRKAQNSSDANDLSTFSKWLLDIGDGKINEPNNEIYGTSFATRTDAKFFCERAILNPRNDDVNKINQYMLSQIPGLERQYLSSDSVETSDTSAYDNMIYTQEFLNNIQVFGLPNHVLTLKKGAPIMFLRNIDPKRGLCNGTRLIVTQMANHVIEARIITVREFVTKRVLLLVDEKGDTIEAPYLPDTLTNLLKYIDDGEWYSIRNFKVINPTMEERNTHHPYQIKFTGETKMRLLESLSPKNYFRFEDLDDIKRGRIDHHIPFDVCACIMDVEDRRNPASIIDNDEVVLILLNGRCTMS